MEKTKHFLVVDDDQDIRQLLSNFLAQHNYQVSTACNGEEMLSSLQEQQFDLIILDIMMPGMDGFELCRQVRQHSHVPIIMLTASGEESDRIVGLELGADDYIAKPFSPRELLARAKAILRRVDQPTEHKFASDHVIYEFSGWRLDMGRRRLLAPDDVEISLSAGEYELLVALIEHPGRVMTRDNLLDITRNREAGPFDRSIDVQISRIRQKIEENPKSPQLIKTVRGGGYIFSCTVKRL